MKKNRIKVYWLLLMILVYTATCLATIGQTQARYMNTATGKIMVDSENVGITSDCLITQEQEPLTVLVGEMSLYKPAEVTFSLRSSGAEATGNLAWSVADKDHAKYLQITMASGSDPILPNMEVSLFQDANMDITMTLTPTEVARTVAHGQLKIMILVTWGDEMWGTFQVVLPEVVKETDVSEDPENIADEPDEEGEAPIPSEVSEPETQQTESAEENTQPNEENTDPSEETTDATEETEPREEITPTEAATEPPEESDGSDSPEEAPQDPIRINTLSRFDPKEKLPVCIYMTPDITAVRLGLWEINEKETEDPENPVMEFKPFPDGTKFSVNQGKSYYMMYDGYIAEFSLAERTELSVLLDFNLAELNTEESLTLGMEAYAGDELIYSGQAETTPDAPDAYRTMTRPLVQTEQKETEAKPERPPATETGGINILGQGNALEFNLPMEWLEAEVEYTVEFLTMTEEQKLEYIPVDLKAGGISAKYVDYDLTHQVVLQVGKNLPQAGTYRLNLKWTYEGICFAHTQTTFFINYSAQTNTLLGG